ncbi:hypothetical protein SUGI_0487020 [Cryptomeria japonica]|uniref:F-box protein GID2 n=1 Tax=Cryptomeria japonica TaxID=3369 RepID=UPI002408BF86|nr:F-box protein GID2 [Cryptomeria japonica]XP_057854535.1 F-box protein GID2 [Cryptomeria japonica]XP_057854536.1 F-box protein GID2 [Cryptomeria japonica]GLJ25431.1 hypothetical protein SUGI_0487020 [Cryptomeria japonica]
MGLAIRRPRKSKINCHHHSYKPNRDLEMPLFHKTSQKMQSQDLCEMSSRDQKEQLSLDGDLLSEVMKHMDARTLARASCVNKVWHKAAQDDKLWENICLKHWANTGCGSHQLRSVVLALGGFRRLYSLCLWPMLNPSASSSSSLLAPQSFSPFLSKPGLNKKHSAKAQSWGKDEVNLSLSLFSIHCYEKMSNAPMQNLSSAQFQSAKHPIFEDSSGPK